MLFSVFTPVYNRRNTIHRVWDSLCAQSLQDFEWIVIDDGSDDGIGEILDTYAKSATFPIQILKQKNMGKHVAWNKAVQLANGELFLPLDSDDACIPTALEVFASLWNSIAPDEKKLFSGINVLCSDAVTGRIVGNPFPITPIISNNLELLYVYNVYGEKWGCVRTEILRQNLFPNATRGYFPEAYIWFSIARRYMALCVNEPLRIYYSDQNNHITGRFNWGSKNQMPAKYEFLSWHIRTNWDFICKKKLLMLKDCTNLWRLGINIKKSFLDIMSNITRPNGFWLMLMMPAGLAISLIDRIRWLMRSR